MNKQDLEQSWARTEELLNEAAAFVQQSDSENLVQYKEYLDHNELELAMDELLFIGKEAGYPSTFFLHLKLAAQNMGLTERAKEIDLIVSMSGWGDPRCGVWNAFHDGEITIAEREAPEVIVMFVSIPYVRRRIQPLGDSFRLRLGGFRGLVLDNEIGSTHSDIEDLEGLIILECLSDTMPVIIQVASGKLMLDFDSLEICLDNGQAISAEEIYRAYDAYWDEWSKKSKQV
jgi:hypothetical protein